MQIIDSILLLMLSVVILAIIVRDSLKLNPYILSVRNIFLAGFLLFQTVSATITLWTGANERSIYLSDPGRTGLWFFALCCIFITIFLFAYKYSARLMPSAFLPLSSRIVSSSKIVFISLVSLTIGVILRFLISQIPSVGLIAIEVAVGCFSLACCLLVWEWGKKPWNPIIGVALLASVTVSVLSLLVNAFGRREILTIFMCMAWMLFYLKFRLMSVGQLLIRITVWGSLVIIIILVFSAARSGKEKDRGISEYIQAIANISTQDIEEQLISGLNGQFAGGISMWIYETRPIEISYDYFHTIKYMATLPIPRSFYNEKPNSLGRALVKEALISGVAEDHSLGPGIIGHMINDFPWVSIPLYAIGLAIIFRYIDIRAACNCKDPFQIAILGAGISQIFALSRGELGLFVILAFCYMAGSWLIVRISLLFLKNEIYELEDLDISEDELNL
ncbi:MAG: hypothetical protein WCQ44_00845 [Opitutaceae bacterium]